LNWPDSCINVSYKYERIFWSKADSYYSETQVSTFSVAAILKEKNQTYASAMERLTIGYYDSVEIRLPFPFCYYGLTYTKIALQTEGVIMLQGRIADPYLYIENPKVSGYVNSVRTLPLIAPYWYALDPSADGANVYIGKLGNDTYAIVFQDVPYWLNATERVTFELLLTTTGVIQINYVTIPQRSPLDKLEEFGVVFRSEYSDQIDQICYQNNCLSGFQLHNYTTILMVPTCGDYCTTLNAQKSEFTQDQSPLSCYANATWCM
jgi:hypothetical protein